MVDPKGVKIYSEIGPLKRVLLHCPGKELDNLTPIYMKSLLFEDIPDRVAAAKEHHAFSEVLRNAGAEIYYVTELLADVLKDEEVRRPFLVEFLKEARVPSHTSPEIFEYLNSIEDLSQLAEVVMSGLRCEDFVFNDTQLDWKKTLLLEPMPNLYFTRDPMTAVGCGISINCMWAQTRRRETLISHFITKYHALFKGVPHYCRRGENATLEGGDVLVLSPQVIAVGVSQRTELAAVKAFARNVLNSGDSFKHILVLSIPEIRAFMHLDTVFTMIDRDIFVVHQEIEESLEVSDITIDTQGELCTKSIVDNLETTLKRYLGLSAVELIRCGGTSRVDAQREQWNDGSNTLAIAPGEVIVYDRNRVTNRLLREAGVVLHEIPSSEVSRGRGGPRCMSQPLWREDVN